MSFIEADEAHLTANIYFHYNLLEAIAALFTLQCKLPT